MLMILRSIFLRIFLPVIFATNFDGIFLLFANIQVDIELKTTGLFKHKVAFQWAIND